MKAEKSSPYGGAGLTNAEAAVISAILQDGDAVDRVRAVLRVSHFADPWKAFVLHRKERLEYWRAYYLAHRAEKQAYAAAHCGHRRADQRAYYARNREKPAASQRASRAAHRDERNAARAAKQAQQQADEQGGQRARTLHSVRFLTVEELIRESGARLPSERMP